MENPTIKNLLKSKNFNDEEAASVVEDIEKTVDRKFESNAERFATKRDIMDLMDDLKDDINEIHKVIGSLFWKITAVILGQMGLIFLILKLCRRF